MVDLARRQDPPIKPWDPTRTPDPGGCPPLGGTLAHTRSRREVDARAQVLPSGACEGSLVTACRCGRLIPRWRTWCGPTCRMRFWRLDRRVLDRGPWLPGIVWRAGTLAALPPAAPDAWADGGDGDIW